MKSIFALFVFLLGFSNLYAQNAQPPQPPTDDKVYTFVQQKPNFQGDVYKWLADNIIYPQDAKKNNIQGTVYVSFVVEKDGSISQAKVIRSADTSLGREAVRAISSMPKWNPGMQNGKQVRVAYMLPIRFTLKDDNTTPLPPIQNNMNQR